MEYLKLNLEDKTAIVRVKDEIEHGDTLIVQAHFNEAGAMLEWIRNDRKPKSHGMDNEAMDLLAEAWLDFRGRLLQHDAEKVQAHETAIKQAQELAESVKFDLEGLNVLVAPSPVYNGYCVDIPAYSYHRYMDARDVADKLVDAVKAAFADLKYQVEDSETRTHLHPDWQKIVDSYRRIFPLNPLHEEPIEIVQARALLKENLHTADWAVCSVYPGTTADCWSFDNGLEGDKHHAMFNQPAADILAFVKMTLNTLKQAEQGEPTIDEQAWELLDSLDKESWTLDFNDHDYKLTVHSQTIFEHIPAEQLLDHIRQYINARTLELARG